MRFKKILYYTLFLSVLLVCFGVQAQSLDPDLNCENAVEIPVNTGVDCVQYARGSFEHAGMLPLGLTCGRAVDSRQKKNLFRFRAAAETHLFRVFDARSDVLPETRTSFFFTGAVYTDCNFDSPAKICFAFLNSESIDGSASNTEHMVLSELVVGQEYYLVLGADTVIRYNNIDYNNDLRFKVCLRAAEVPYVQIEANDAMTENVDWVEEKFLYSDCDNIFSNIRFQAGDGQNDFNSIGYFNKNNSTFLLEKGIALSTTDLSMNLSAANFSDRFQQNSPSWTGDADLNALQLEIPGQQQLQPSATAVLEFDFIALNEQLDIDYVFSWTGWIGEFQYLGIWLTDLTTQNKQNIARVPGTNLPIHQELVIDNYPELGSPEIIPLWNNPLIYWMLNSKVFPTKPTVLTVGRKYRLKFGVGNIERYAIRGIAMFIQDFEQQLNDVELSIVDQADLCTGKPWLIKANT
ncbi:choice-of-anchor L domain-containing protein, partial [Flavobacterium sp. NKUCC04_CG]|uniref:choice-of-anchor L domain-containing protein n=1 Tax=Flavobacterium sp. NKUCC04_CG TaxID=2842121 RepID=UPI001C5B31E2